MMKDTVEAVIVGTKIETAAVSKNPTTATSELPGEFQFYLTGKAFHIRKVVLMQKKTKFSYIKKSLLR